MEIFNDIFFNVTDVLIIIIILTSSITAAFRGFVKELFSIISWIISLIVSIKLFNKFKNVLEEHSSQQLIIDTVAFGFPFITTLLVCGLISSWLSPKFNMSEILFIDKLMGFVFGTFRGTLIVVLLYLGFIYLIGAERKLPDILLQSYSFEYVSNFADILSKIFVNENIVNIEKEKYD